METGDGPLQQRTYQFAVRIVKLFQALPNRQDARVLGNQLLRCGTSVAANYRAACRGRSKADFVSKLGIVQEEADEALFWLDLLTDTGIMKRERLSDLMKECDEILAMVTASRITAQGSADSALGARHSAIRG